VVANILKETSAVILAGGKSSRMGRDKNKLLFDGEPLLLRAVNTLGPLFGEIVIVTNQDIPTEIQDKLHEAKIIRDEIPYLGPLGGIGAGLKASSYERSFVVAVDMPFVSIPVIDYLASFAGRVDIDIVVPRTKNGLEPLFAFYDKKCLPAIDNLLSRDERKVRALFSLAQVRVKIVEHAEFGNYPDAGKCFININTEQDLTKAGIKSPSD
jgi:molybdopterin-guanine dinucleotide biosynthesis protein A